MKQKEHKSLVFFMPFFMFFCVIGEVLLGGAATEHLGPVTGYLASTGISLLFLLGLFCLFAKILPKKRSHVLDYRFRKTEVKPVVAVACAFFAFFMLEEIALYFLLIRGHDIPVEQIVYTNVDIREDLLAALHAVLLGPVIEELCFRIIPISMCRKKSSKIIMLIFTSVLFGICHGKNFAASALDGFMYGMILIKTENPIYSVAAHMAHNLFLLLMGIACYFNVMALYKPEYMIPIFLLNKSTTIFLLLLLGGLIIYASDAILYLKKAIQKQ